MEDTMRKQATDTGHELDISANPGSESPDTVNPPPLRGTGRALGTSEGRMKEDLEPVGERAIFVLVREDSDETPVFEVDGNNKAVAVFTDRNLAFLYLQASGWDPTHRPASLTPSQLGQWIRTARES